MAEIKTAAFIIIGNEILSGRTPDKNLNFLATELSQIGVRLMEVRVVPDITEEIIEAVNALRSKFDYVFTSGGIGPTHDDITSDAVAKAFNTKIFRHPEAEARLIEYYSKDKLNDSRLKMADIPFGADLLDNPISSAPGFKIENVYVMAGVPEIMRSMFIEIRDLIKGGDIVKSKSISALVGESEIAGPLAELQSEYMDIEIGSYPFIKEAKVGTSLVFRAVDEGLIDEAVGKLREILEESRIEVAEEK